MCSGLDFSFSEISVIRISFLTSEKCSIILWLKSFFDDGDNLDINTAFNEDGLIKEKIRREATYRINFCKEETKLAMPKIIKKLPEGVELDEKRIEDLATVFPLQYLSMFETK